MVVPRKPGVQIVISIAELNSRYGINTSFHADLHKIKRSHGVVDIRQSHGTDPVFRGLLNELFHIHGAVA
jgi:hypothetical protein